MLPNCEAQSIDVLIASKYRKTLERTRMVVTGPNGAAGRLGIKQSTLYFRMQKLGISRANKGPVQGITELA